ncbi:DUF3141 domain-containing protein [Roseovarius salinarum]|uniref:DUF3141 domain-containing protein n=1 Tax=Roseovarius salinarum TaxID=1981892 RepID=UPI001E65C637|nr:DUF3141 domain-containing protein [Roseovarius salinarum]
MEQLPHPRRLAQDTLVQTDLLATAAERHLARALDAAQDHAGQAQAAVHEVSAAAARAGTAPALMAAWSDYLRDAAQRGAIAADILRRRAEIARDHEAAGSPPVLIYDYEVVIEGRDLPRPCNYRLLRILPTRDQPALEWKRPYVIIDPRAGHGAGIGGFKTDSQVGVALADGHPVYFVAFHPMPEPGQTLADVTHAEAAFLREIARRHPDSPQAVVVGNCQGGWATAILAATHPDLTGPVVLNGAPMSYWGGRLGRDPMRYSGGLAGGVLPALISADLSGGLFDGAHLVANFEALNPGRTWFRKYADLLHDPERAEAAFLEFERWWGGFHLMTRAEIRWIVENLFVGNRLGRNEAFLEPGRPIDLRAIRAPVIVFASEGDEITPPAQALGWIADSYTDEREIEIRGQRILYMVHEKVGHLGIFVSSSVARREHSQMASTLKTIQALAPGLYEMQIEDHAGAGREMTFTVSFARRRMRDLKAVIGARRDETAFAGVARASEATAEAYETGPGPMLRSLVPPQAGDALRALHPLRGPRAATSAVPWAAGLGTLAELARAHRAPAAPGNPFVRAERHWADIIEAGWDALRDMRTAATEIAFLGLWANPLAVWYGAPHARARARLAPDDLGTLPEVQRALARTTLGGEAEAIVRMLILLADSRSDVRRDRLERSNEVLVTHVPFRDMDIEARAAMIHEQGLIAHFDPQGALDSLPRLIRTDAGRRHAVETVEYVLGDRDDMQQATRDLLDRMHRLLRVDTVEAAP